MAASSVVQICNNALQKLGATRITAIDEDSRNARACNATYEGTKQAELRAHVWNFAIKRAELAADSEAPAWGRANAFTLPSDFLRLLPPYPEDNLNSTDWQIEGKKILTDDDAPIYIRYIYNVTDPNEMDALFLDMLSIKLAYDICEEITQSNTKKASLLEDYKDALSEARRINAIENISAKPPEDEWITVRS